VTRVNVTSRSSPTAIYPLGLSPRDRCVWPSFVEGVGRTLEEFLRCVWILAPSAHPGSAISCMVHRGPKA
jgi:hypothetical protein